MVVELLRLDPIAGIIAAVPAVADAHREVQHAVGTELRARRRRATAPGIGLEDLLDGRQRPAVEAGAGNRDRRRRARFASFPSRRSGTRVRLSAKRGCRTTEWRLREGIDGVGHPGTGAGSSTPLRMMRRRPGNSVTRTSLVPGTNVTCHGCTRPLAIVVTAIRTSSPGLQPPCRAPVGEHGPGV